MVEFSQEDDDGRPYLVWLGHSTVLLSLRGKYLLFDPILTSPALFHGKRLGELPVTAEQLRVDYLLISHAHRDHLDRATVEALAGDSVRAFVPLKMGSLVTSWRPDIVTQEAGWYQRYEDDVPVEITLLPAHHWSRRSLFDTNSVLWGSFMVEADGMTVYFAGDTGHADHFREIGALFENIDYAVLPIGAYAPEHLSADSHMTPEEALRAFDDLGAETMIPVHYGTYGLSAEPVAEPLQRLHREIDRRGMSKRSVAIPAIGERLYLTP